MMNGVRYHQVLEDKLELFIAQHNTTHFLHDGAKWFVEKHHFQVIK